MVKSGYYRTKQQELTAIRKGIRKFRVETSWGGYTVDFRHAQSLSRLMNVHSRYYRVTVRHDITAIHLEPDEPSRIVFSVRSRTGAKGLVYVN